MATKIKGEKIKSDKKTAAFKRRGVQPVTARNWLCQAAAVAPCKGGTGYTQ